MGRITVFVTDASTACNRVIVAFKARKIPISVISLSQHPDKRDDMFSLCMLHSTPQVFFNTRHIGGAESTLELLDEWTASCVPEEHKSSTHSGSSLSSFSSGGSNSKGGSKGSIEKSCRRGSKTSKQSSGTARRSTHSSRSTKSYASVYSRYMAEIGSFHDPHDKRLALPERPPILPEACLPRDVDAEFCIAIPGDASTVLEMTQMFVDLIKNEDHTAGSTTYKQSFEGFKVIKVLQETFEISEKEAFKLASHLLSVGIFVLLNGSSGITFDVESLYRLQCYQTPGILNSYRVWTENTDSDALRLVHNLIGKFSEVEVASTDKRGFLHLNRARRMPEYWEFEEAVCELQGVILSKMNQMTKLVSFGCSNQICRLQQVTHDKY
jgi:Glutaredoxin